ncbi:MAG: FixH family protein [Phycisphaerales bacterium]
MSAAPTATSAGSNPSTAPKRLSRWGILFRFPGVLVLMVGTLVTVDVCMIIVATSDQSFAVSDDAGDQGEAWMASRDQVRQNQRLGWTPAVSVDTPSDANPRVRYELRDASGTPISGATVALAAFHHARAADRRRTMLHEDPEQPGVYMTRLPLNRIGRWAMNFEVHHGEVRFTSEHESTILLVAEGAG